MFITLIKQIPTLREPEACQDVLQLKKFPEKATDTLNYISLTSKAGQ
mgnify:CR=1 FL=1